MAVAAAAALPAVVQAGIPISTAALGGCDSRCPSKRYRKYELIGQGAQKKVYRAFDEERGIEVAWNEVAVAELARFREKDQQRVFAEIRVLKQLKHKNIMTLHDYWFDERRLMLIFITEIFPDGTLRQYRRRHKHADLPAIKRWAWQILQGLVYLHGHNPPIIHRDLKCDNIFVCGSSGIVKIGDLGLVTLCKDFSAPQSVLGTPEFMAPELYEEKYDEKVDVYAFGMCLLELATMEYPYCECKNAAQIYKKVTQGIPPASVERLVSAELREFVMLCLCHDPGRRPEARQLLKHSFFEAIRASPPHISSGYGTPPKLTVVSSSISASPSNAAPLPLRPTALAGAGTAAAAALVVVAAGTAADVQSPTALSRAASSSSGGGSTSATAAAELGGFFSAAGPAMGGIAAATVGGAAASSGSLLSVRSSSVELPRQQSTPLGAIASAALSPQPLSPIAAAAASGSRASGHCSLAAAMNATAAVAVVAPALGSIAAAVSAPLPSIVGGAQLSVSPLSMGGPDSIASSLSPTDRLGTTGSAFAEAAGGSGASSPSIPLATSAASPVGRPGPDSQHGGGGSGGSASPIFSGLHSAESALTAALQLSPSPGCGGALARDGPGYPVPRPAMSDDCESDAYGGRCGLGTSPNGGYASRSTECRSQQPAGPYAGLSASAAAIAAAAVSAAAAAVGVSSVPTMASPLGLPAIDEDHELDEDMMFDPDESGRRGGQYGGANDSDGEDDREVDDCCGLGADSPDGAVSPSVVGGGGRSQPVNLKVRSSNQAAINNMALSFAMSFTSQRGVRKKVGFQYDLLHDTAQNIAVEMVENLSLNTAEAEAIAAMIQHEVSRFNARQQQQQQQEQQEQQEQ